MLVPVPAPTKGRLVLFAKMVFTKNPPPAMALSEVAELFERVELEMLRVPPPLSMAPPEAPLVVAELLERVELEMVRVPEYL